MTMVNAAASRPCCSAAVAFDFLLPQLRWPQQAPAASQRFSTRSRRHAGRSELHWHREERTRLQRSQGAASSDIENIMSRGQRRHFHDYFVTHLPSSSLHPDSRTSGLHHKLPRAAATAHNPHGTVPPVAPPHMAGASRDLTVVRIPLRKAKHHFGAAFSRGTRPYNEDTYQAGTIELPAFAKRGPVSLSHGKSVSMGAGEGTSADSASGDPQIFYFGVFDGHGGTECSTFLREELHRYVESAAVDFGFQSSLKHQRGRIEGSESSVEDGARSERGGSSEAISQPPAASRPSTFELERELVNGWKTNVGGYFRRFRPEHFLSTSMDDATTFQKAPSTIEAVLTYAFLSADLDFVTAQAQKPHASNTDTPLNNDEVLGFPSRIHEKLKIGGPTRFVGGSTASVAVISTPTPMPFWHPASPSSLVVAHVGDTRILLCATRDGQAVPLTTDHHPSNPVEAGRLRRWATTFVTDSFGEERMSGLANTRAFGDMRSKRMGVSAEPEISRYELGPAEYSFLVLVSDGVSGSVSDQEIVDIVKEARTPEDGARDVVSYATEVSKEGDNATCLVVRLGGWERRSEGGGGSLGTREMRDFKLQEASDPRKSRR